MTPEPDGSELAQHGVAPSPQIRKPSGIAVGLAAAMPFVIGLLATVVFIVGLGREGTLHFAQETGWPFYAVLLGTWGSALVLTVTLVLAGRGARVPTAVSLFFAGLPWVVGVAGVRFSTSSVLDALHYADPSARAMLIAKGIAEASGARLLGAWCTSALAAALALGLAIAALGQRSTNRKPLFGAVGGLLATPVVALAGYAVISRVFDAYALFAVIASLGVLAALSLGAAGAGDSPHARAAALSAAIPPVTFLSFVAAVAAMETGGFRGAFNAVANAAADQRAMMLWMGAESFIVGGRITSLAAAAFGVAALVLVGWAASRARPTLGRIVGGVAVVFVAGLVVGADRLADLGTEHDLGKLQHTAWQGVEGFTPATIIGSREHGDDAPVTVVTVDSILPPGSARIALSTLDTPTGRAALTAALRASQRHEPAEQGTGDPTPNEQPSVTLAIDARVRAPVLRALFEIAQAAGARSIMLVGSGVELQPGAIERLEAEAPLVAFIAQSTGSVRVLLLSALSPGYADASDTAPHSVAYLTLADDATSNSFAKFAVAAARESLTPLVVVGSLPGRPETPVATDAPDALGHGLGFGGFGQGVSPR